MNTKLLLLICLLLLAAKPSQAQELIRFREDFTIPLKYGFKDKNGTVVIQPLYTEVGNFSEGFVRVKTEIDVDGYYRVYWKYLDTKGKKLGQSYYNKAKDFSEGFAAVQIVDNENELDGDIRPGNWVYIDKSGKEAITTRYLNAHSFSEGLAVVQSTETKKWGVINQTGKEVIPLIFDRIGEGGLFWKEEERMFQNGKIKAQKDGREFFIDTTGKEIEDDNAVIQKMATAYQSGNFTEAFKLALELAKKGNAAATNLLGTMYAQGQGTTQNFIVARTYWEKASKLGNAAATGNIGLLYAQGWGVSQNMAEAENWFKKGADMGDAQSMFNLGNLAFQKGNFTEAKQWIQKAKTAGHPQADIALQQIKQAESQTNPIKVRDKQ